MAGSFTGPVLLDQPSDVKNRPYAADSWLEPWLINHSEFYRNHFTRDGRRESKSTRRHSVVAEGLESRKNSVDVPQVDSEAARAAVPEAEATGAMPAAVEQQRSSSEVEASALQNPETLHKKNKISSWRYKIGWFPHP